MPLTRLHINPAFVIDTVDPRIYGGFLEHMGRAVYEGVYDPASKHADEHGCRKDVLEVLQKLRFTAMRYPGGNFVSGYHWQDGVGPKELRPKIRDLAWQSLETNQFGTNEFMRLNNQMGWTPMFAVNLGTGTPEEARNWVEYTNIESGSKFADLRVEHGVKKPHDIKLWCLGNEMDGPWQLGHVPAEHYAVRAQQAAKMMRDVDPSIELVVCGSCAPDLSTYIEWDYKVLAYTHQDVHYISAHRYVGNPANESEDYLAVGASIDQQIEELDSVCRAVQASKRSKRKVKISFDEWNVWYRARHGDHMNGRGKFAPHLLEEHYNLEDALVCAQFLNSFIRHADCVKIANLAQIVNVIAPIMTRGDEMFCQTIFHTIALFNEHGYGRSLRVVTDGSTYESRNYGVVPDIDASAVLDGNRLKVFAVNRSTFAANDVHLELTGASAARVISASIVTGPSAQDMNTFEDPNRITARPFDGVSIRKHAIMKLPPLSMVAVVIELA